MSSPPVVSVLIPVYNAGPYLREAIESIIAQSYEHLDIIIIDDGSTDGCMATIEDLCDPRVRIIAQANAGKSAALNRGLDTARGDFFLIQDADDVSYPRRVERQLASLSENPDLAAVYVGNDLILDGVKFAPIFDLRNRDECRRAIEQFKMPAHDATGLYRMGMVADIRFDENLRIGQGVDYVLRVGERFPIMTIGECLYSHRVNFDSVTHRGPKRSCEAINRVRQKACCRRGLDFEKYKIPVPQSQRVFRHRSLDTIVTYAVQSAFCLRQAGRFSESLRTAWICARRHPFDPYYYKPFIHAILPPTLMRWFRRVKTRRQSWT